MFSPASESSLVSCSTPSTYHFGGSESPSCHTDNSDSNSSTMFDIKHLDLNADFKTDSAGVRLVIHEEPVDKFRFRYKSEMHGTHGSLTGASSGKKKTFPAVDLLGYADAAFIRCSLHQTDTYRDRMHSHSLVVRRDSEDKRDPHDVRVGPDVGFRAEFHGMGIIHTAKKFIEVELLEKLLERRQLMNGGVELTELQREELRVHAEAESKLMNLNQVCLAFEAYRMVGGRYEQLCEPVYSRPINNMKSALTGELKITRLSATCCDAAGNSDLFLFVEKVGKKNIQVRFYEADENEDIVWQDYGQFAESDVHHQYAIALRTPPYRNKDIEEKVNVFVQLFRKSDQCCSAPLPFYYKPCSSTVTRKRARMCSFNSAELPTVLANVNNHHNHNNNAHNNANGHINGGPAATTTTMAMATVLASPMLSSLTSFPPFTISKEYNKSDLIEQLMAKSSEEILLNYVMHNSDEFMPLMDEDELQEDGHATGGAATTTLSSSSSSSMAAVDSIRDNRIESRVRLLRQQIDRVARTQTRTKARDYLQQMWIAANAKLDILHLALSDEGGDRAAQLVIDLLADYELTTMLLNLPDAFQHHYALHTACVYNRHACIAKMLRLGADPNKCDRENNTPLHRAVLERFANCVAAICDARNYPAGSQLHIDATNDDGFTALHLAIRADHVDMVQILTAAGASAAKRDARQGNNGLHMAVQCNSTDIVEHLLATSDVNVNDMNTSNLTALELASIDAHTTEPVILQLLRCDARTSGVRPSSPQPLPVVVSPPTSPSLRSVVTPTTCQSTLNRVEPLFDAVCLRELCDLFNAADGWKHLAAVLQLGDFVGMWEVSADPTRMMFRFAEAQGFQLPHIVNIFVELDNREALGCLDEMIARRMEKD